jgi:hypothetical protein
MAVLEEKVSLQSPYLPQDLLSTHFLMNLRERCPFAKYKIEVAILKANVKRKLAHPCIYQHWLVRLLLSWFVVDKKPKLLERKLNADEKKLQNKRNKLINRLKNNAWLAKKKPRIELMLNASDKKK